MLFGGSCKTNFDKAIFEEFDEDVVVKNNGGDVIASLFERIPNHL